MFNGFFGGTAVAVGGDATVATGFAERAGVGCAEAVDAARAFATGFADAAVFALLAAFVFTGASSIGVGSSSTGVYVTTGTMDGGDASGATVATIGVDSSGATIGVETNPAAAGGIAEGFCAMKAAVPRATAITAAMPPRTNGERFPATTAGSWVDAATPADVDIATTGDLAEAAGVTIGMAEDARATGSGLDGIMRVDALPGAGGSIVSPSTRAMIWTLLRSSGAAYGSSACAS
jgi:hypothetical protein